MYEYDIKASIDELNYTMGKILQILFIKESVELGGMTEDAAIKSMQMVSDNIKSHVENKMERIRACMNNTNSSHSKQSS